MKRFLAAVLCVAFLAGMTACDGNSANKSLTATSGTSFTAAPLSPTDSRTAGPRPTETTLVGGTIRIGDIFYFDEWDCSVTSYDFAKQVFNPDGSVLGTANDGYQYMRVWFQLTNNSAIENSFPFNKVKMQQKVFKIYYNASELMEISSTFRGDDLMSKTFAPFSTGTGYFVFMVTDEVPTTAKSIYMTGGTGDKVITVRLR